MNPLTYLSNMVETAIGSPSNGIMEPLKSRITVTREAYDEFQRLENDTRLLKGFLEDMDGNELDLGRQMKELARDVENIRDSWLIHRAANDNIWSKHLTLIAFNRVYSLGMEIRSIRDARIDPMLRRIEAYGDLQDVTKHPAKSNQVPSVKLNKEVSPIRLKKIVGFEDEAGTLISSLMQETEVLEVISITGMLGIGKTTLARKIYEDDTVRSKFPTRIWVDIPLDICSKDLYLYILKDLIKQGMVDLKELVMWLDMPQESSSNVSYVDTLTELTESGRINDHQLIHAVHSCLKKNRFLLVMDDVWNGDTLESVRCFMPKMGKVLITSRDNRVTGKPHVLRVLNEEESWELLQLGVSGKVDERLDTLKSVGECIARNCDGSPLAILVIASGLVMPSSSEGDDDLTEKWWKKVSENVTTYITDYGAQHKVFERVELSYIRLTPCLRDCFLYMGVFPQDHEIPVSTLIRLWIAEGLVQDSWGLTLEEIAELNLYDLVNRNLVVVGKIYPNGQLRTCRLHKLIYGFCKYKAAEQEFYHEVRLRRGGALDGPTTLTRNHRRLCIYSCLSEFLSNRPNGQSIRSILCLDKEDKVLDPKDCSIILDSFKLLKIFEGKGVKFTKFPIMLSKLLNLRYISLSCDHLEVIPETISSLCYLETLVVVTQMPSIDLKANIWKMLQLQHLVTKAAIVLAKGEGEAGKNLQTLTRLAPTCCTEDVFTRAPNLKKLGIRGHLAAPFSVESVRILKLLQQLKLINEPAAESQLHTNCFPANLRRLTLSGTWLKWECMSILAGVDRLEILKLKNNAFKGASWSSSHNADGFRGLGLLFIHTADLVSWDASAGCFPNLKRLVLENCQQLHQIPATLADSLDTLDVKDVPQSAHDSAKQIEQKIATRQQPQNRS